MMVGAAAATGSGFRLLENLERAIEVSYGRRQLGVPE
jgi:hypothetical protein